eukprot:6022156-Prymnesium_polylepis.1
MYFTTPQQIQLVSRHTPPRARPTAGAAAVLSCARRPRANGISTYASSSKPRGAQTETHGTTYE